MRHLLEIIIVSEVVIPYIILILQVYVVVAVEHDKPVVIMKSSDGLICFIMRVLDVYEPRVFPKLVSVAGFDISESVIIVVVHRMQVSILVLCEFI